MTNYIKKYTKKPKHYMYKLTHVMADIKHVPPAKVITLLFTAKCMIWL